LESPDCAASLAIPAVREDVGEDVEEVELSGEKEASEVRLFVEPCKYQCGQSKHFKQFCLLAVFFCRIFSDVGEDVEEVELSGEKEASEVRLFVEAVSLDDSLEVDDVAAPTSSRTAGIANDAAQSGLSKVGTILLSVLLPLAFVEASEVRLFVEAVSLDDSLEVDDVAVAAEDAAEEETTDHRYPWERDGHMAALAALQVPMRPVQALQAVLPPRRLLP
jgi:hypothetical protein